MATHSSILAWKIPWTEERGRLQSTVSRRVGHSWEQRQQNTKVNTSLPESGWNQEIFATTITFLNFTSSPLTLCFIKATSIQTQARWLSGTQRASLPAGFPNKVAISAPTTGVSIYWPVCCARCSMSSDLVTRLENGFQPLKFYEL